MEISLENLYVYLGALSLKGGQHLSDSDPGHPKGTYPYLI